MVVRMRHTRAHTRNRRSHHKIKGERLSICAKCKAHYIRHRACLSCGTYKGRVVIDATKKVLKKEKKEKAKEKTASK